MKRPRILPGIIPALRRHPLAAAAAAVVLAAALALGAGLFQPWRLFTSSVLNEAPPTAAGPSVTPSTDASLPTSSSAGPMTPGPAQPSVPPVAVPAPVVVASGAFLSQEHATTGTASLIRLPDGSHVIRLENLASSDGPDVKVWLSDQAAGGDWFKYRAGRYLDLGPIKATHGNQNYALPAGADFTGLGTLVLWCDRFSVAFGSAALG